MSTATLDHPVAPQPTAAQPTGPQLAAALPAAQPTGPLAAPHPAPAGVRTQETRVYRGRTVDELLPSIQFELGADAVVVRRESGLSGGIAGFFQRPYVEIEARPGTPAIDCYDDTPALPDLPPPAEPEPFHELIPAFVKDDDPFAAALAEAEAAVAPALPDPALPGLTLPDPTIPDPALPHPTLPGPALPRTPAATAAPAGRTRAAIERALRDTGMSEEFVSELIETAAAHVLPLMPGRPSLVKAVHAALVQRIPACTPLPTGGAPTAAVGPGGAPTAVVGPGGAAIAVVGPGGAAIAVVGPGGAGKSSCCAALLDAYRRRSTWPAACATLGVELTAAERTALVQARAQGMLLLDTPALSPADPAAIRANAATLRELRPDRVVLALPATLGARPAAQLLEALAPLGANALAITHADETDQLGVAVQAACAFGIAPAYLLSRPGRARAGGGLTPVDPANLADRLLPPR